MYLLDFFSPPALLLPAAFALGCGGSTLATDPSSTGGASTSTTGGSTSQTTDGSTSTTSTSTTSTTDSTSTTTDSTSTTTPTFSKDGLWWKHLQAPDATSDSWMTVPGAMTIDPHGHVLITGRANSVVDFEAPAGTTGAAPRCLFLAKYDADGTFLWAKQFGTSLPYSQITGITADTDDSIVLTGQFEGGPVSFGGPDLGENGTTGMFVARLDAAGNHLWSLRRGGKSWDNGGGVAIDPSGRVVTAGVVDHHLTVLWISPAGEVVLEKTTPGYISINAAFLTPVAGVTVDDSGNAIVAGTFQANGADFGSGPTPKSPFEAGFVASFQGSDGALGWVRTFPTKTGYQFSGGGVFLKGIVATKEGVAVTGNFPGTIDLGSGYGPTLGADSGFVVSLAAKDGSTQWSAAIGAKSSLIGMTRAPDDHLAVTATWQGLASFGASELGGTGLHLLTVDPAGNLLKSRPIVELGAAGAQSGEMQPIAVDAKGQLALDLGFLSQLDMPIATVPKGEKSLEDLFLLHLAP